MGYTLLNIKNNLRSFLAHLVPRGTPIILAPFIVLVELIRRVLRPFTLAVRLAANIIAGHLLLALASLQAPVIGYSILAVTIVALISLVVLEIGVAMVQRYVFMALSSLYIREVNHPNN